MNFRLHEKHHQESDLPVERKLFIRLKLKVFGDILARESRERFEIDANCQAFSRPQFEPDYSPRSLSIHSHFPVDVSKCIRNKNRDWLWAILLTCVVHEEDAFVQLAD